MSGSGQLQIQTRSVGGAVVVSPQGDIDLTASPSLRAELKKAAGQAPLIVDLAGVSYMDSSGVATLVEAMQAARKGKSKFVLCALQERVKTILHIARLDSFFTIAATVDEAVAK